MANVEVQSDFAVVSACLDHSQAKARRFVVHHAHANLSHRLGQEAPQPFADSVAPILKRASTMLAIGTERLLSGLALTPLPGHSARMIGLTLERQWQRGMLVCDLLHSPVQIWRPDWSSRYAADNGLLLLAAHLCGTGGFWVRRTESGFDPLPAPAP